MWHKLILLPQTSKAHYLWFFSNYSKDLLKKSGRTRYTLGDSECFGSTFGNKLTLALGICFKEILEIKNQQNLDLTPLR